MAISNYYSQASRNEKELSNLRLNKAKSVGRAAVNAAKKAADAAKRLKHKFDERRRYKVPEQPPKFVFVGDIAARQIQNKPIPIKPDYNERYGDRAQQQLKPITLPAKRPVYKVKTPKPFPKPMPGYKQPRQLPKPMPGYKQPRQLPKPRPVFKRQSKKSNIALAGVKAGRKIKNKIIPSIPDYNERYGDRAQQQLEPVKRSSDIAFAGVKAGMNNIDRRAEIAKIDKQIKDIEFRQITSVKGAGLPGGYISGSKSAAAGFIGGRQQMAKNKAELMKNKERLTFRQAQEAKQRFNINNSNLSAYKRKEKAMKLKV